MCSSPTWCACSVDRQLSWCRAHNAFHWSKCPCQLGIIYAGYLLAGDACKSVFLVVVIAQLLVNWGAVQ